MVFFNSRSQEFELQSMLNEVKDGNDSRDFVKILVQGDPGVGKSTLCEKIAQTGLRRKQSLSNCKTFRFYSLYLQQH